MQWITAIANNIVRSAKQIWAIVKQAAQATNQEGPFSYSQESANAERWLHFITAVAMVSFSIAINQSPLRSYATVQTIASRLYQAGLLYWSMNGNTDGRAATATG